MYMTRRHGVAMARYLFNWEALPGSIIYFARFGLHVVVGLVWQYIEGVTV